MFKQLWLKFTSFSKKRLWLSLFFSLFVFLLISFLLIIVCFTEFILNKELETFVTLIFLCFEYLLLFFLILLIGRLIYCSKWFVRILLFPVLSLLILSIPIFWAVVIFTGMLLSCIAGTGCISPGLR
jgi:hypothetical protein